ncbi:MAG: hypothetical protein PF437_03835 [Sulfurimonas sp.]|nr:hypothetical protein [Sulfurimonas sp.]
MISDIQYVEVEVVNKKKSTKFVKGLLTGYTPAKDLFAQFIRIALGANSSLYCSSAFYSVISLTVAHGDKVEQTFYLEDRIEQDKAITAIELVMFALRAGEIANLDGTIDTKKYVDAPAIYGNLDEKKTPMYPAGTSKKVAVNKLPELTKIHSGSHPLTGAKPYVAPVHKPYVAPVKEAMYIRRRTKKPTEKFLLSLLLKVKGINDGSYLPDTLEIIEIEDKKETKNQVDFGNGFEADEEMESWRERYGGMIY